MAAASSDPTFTHHLEPIKVKSWGEGEGVAMRGGGGSRESNLIRREEVRSAKVAARLPKLRFCLLRSGAPGLGGEDASSPREDPPPASPPRGPGGSLRSPQPDFILASSVLAARPASASALTSRLAVSVLGVASDYLLFHGHT